MSFMKQYSRIVLILLTISLFSSCKVFYPSRMFKQKDYQFFEFAKKKISEYTIEPDDILSIQIYSRDGFKLIDVFGGGEVAGGSGGASFLVDKDGFVKLPVLGDFYVKGYSHRELENVLAQKFSNLVVEPYVIVKVQNRKAFIFNGSSASVIPLNEYPTSLVEVLTKTGGLSRDVKAYKIKIIRGDLSNPSIQLVDLSTMEGIRNTNLTILPNDIIYVEEKQRVARDVLREITPFISGISIIISTVYLIRSIGR